MKLLFIPGESGCIANSLPNKFRCKQGMLQGNGFWRAACSKPFHDQLYTDSSSCYTWFSIQDGWIGDDIGEWIYHTLEIDDKQSYRILASLEQKKSAPGYGD